MLAPDWAGRITVIHSSSRIPTIHAWKSMVFLDGLAVSIELALAAVARPSDLLQANYY
jgi:hypothetical protein